MAIVGTKLTHRVVGQGTFHCERCGGDRPYWHRASRRWIQVLAVPVIPAGNAGEHLRCVICETCYRVELLAVPTMTQMLVALRDGTLAAALAMLAAAEPASAAARRRAIETIKAAGLPEYGEAELAADLAGSRSAGAPADPGHPGASLRRILSTLAIQLEGHAREWFLAGIVRIGLADGGLTTAQRQVIRQIAHCFGMTQAQAQDVIWLTGEAAAAG